MSSVSLPIWFWVFYYLSLFTSLVLAISMFARKQRRTAATFVIFIVLTIPFISLINSIGRGEGMNEGEFLLEELYDGALWALYSVCGYLVLLWCWLKIIMYTVKRRR